MATTALHLTKIELNAFRGIERELSLDLGRRLTIIYGGNATGKSSVAQGIEFALSGQIRDYEDGLVPAGYLANTRAATVGRASLMLDNGLVVSGATDQLRSDIERRFREIGTVDWPERQPLPLTTTHITTQGTLARVLGSTHVVTRNDLSGLCAGAYLRFLVARARKLADHFRQASTGRNIQGELSDARAGYDTAKLLRDSLLTTGQAIDISSTAIDTKLRELNGKVQLPEPTSIDETLSHLDTRLRNSEERLQILQRLLGRARELGQHEAEFNQLRVQLEEAQKSQRGLRESKAEADALLSKIVEDLSQVVKRRVNSLEKMAAYERHQQSVSTISALEARLREVGGTAERVTEEIQTLRQQLESARGELATRSMKLAQVRQARQAAEIQRSTIQQTLLAISLLPSQDDPDIAASIQNLRRELDDLQRAAEAISKDLLQARNEEILLATKLTEISESDKRFAAASSEMRSFAIDGHCPLCGHDHGSVEELDRAIRTVSSALLEETELLRQQFEAVLERRQGFERRKHEHDSRITDCRARMTTIDAEMERKTERRRAATAEIEQMLKRAGVLDPLDSVALKRTQTEIEATIATLDQDIRDETDAERAEETRRAQLERSLTARVSEREQSDRLAAELTDQIRKVRAGLEAGVTPEEVASDREELLQAEQRIKTLEREQGQAQARLAELDRGIATKTSETAGIERRLQVVRSFLDSLDDELNAAGASREVSSLLQLEQRVRQERDDLTRFRGTALDIQQDVRLLDQSRALSKAQEQLADAEKLLKSVQERQQRLQKRSVQLKNLYSNLEMLQNDTADIVLQNIRVPVGTLFHAMTAGCPWDIQFRLEEGKVNAFLSDGFALDLAAVSVLNSAYVNVAAIALRVALASQQRWTKLRTVVLDDPILEMDNLTQSALIDGLEAILSSSFAPWEDLQFVLTTWSEDFAVMAAHKLAHLNNGIQPYSPREENFIIYRLGLEPDGTVGSHRHVPRWQAEATAA